MAKKIKYIFWRDRRRKKLTASFAVVVLFVGVYGALLFWTDVFAATKYWDGGGSTNNWSDCVNWDNNTCPATGDTVYFDATSVKNCTIDAPVTVTNFYIQSTYSGTITVAAVATSTPLLTTNFSQAGGTFNGGTIGSLDFVGFTLSGGTFTAPSSASTTVSSGWTHTTGGTFNHASGTVILDGASSQSVNVNSTEDFYNLVINNSSNGSAVTISSADLLNVYGTLGLVDAYQLTGSSNSGINAYGAVEHNVNFGRNNSTLICQSNSASLNILGDTTRTISPQAGGCLPVFKLNAANATVNLPSSGTSTFYGITLTSGVFDANNGADIVIQSGTYTQDGNITMDMGPGAFDAGSSAFTISTGTFIMGKFFQSGAVTNSGGTFNASSTYPVIITSYTQNSSYATFNGAGGDIDMNGDLTVSIGVFNSTSGTLYFGGANWTHYLGGNFNHASGTVVFDRNSSQSINVASTENFYNFTINNSSNSSAVTISSADILNVYGTLGLIDAFYFSGSSNSGINAYGIVTSTADFGRNNSTLACQTNSAKLNILYSGTATFSTQSGGCWPDTTLNASNVTIALPASGTSTFYGLTIDNGNFDADNGADVVIWSGDYTQNANITVDMGNGYFSASSPLVSGIDFSINAGSFKMGRGFAMGAMTVSGGTFYASSSNPIYIYTYTQSGGTFYGTSGDIDVGNATSNSGGAFTLSGGTFNSTSGTLSFCGNWDSSGGGVFNHSSGTVTLDNTSASGSNSMNANVSVDFYNLNFSRNGGYVSFASNDIFNVYGTLSLIGAGYLSGSTGAINAYGPIVHNAAFASYGPASNYMSLNILGSDSRTINLATGGYMPNITLNAPNVTLVLPSSGTSTFAGLTVTNGVLDANNGANIYLYQWDYTQNGNVDVDMGPGRFIFDGFAGYDFTISSGTFRMGGEMLVGVMTVSGGTFYASSSNPMYIYSYTQSGGTFNAASGIIDSGATANNTAGTFTMTGGTFNAASSTLYMCGSWDTAAGGTFNAASSTVVFDANGASGSVAIDVNSSINFYNLTINVTSTRYITISTADVLNIYGNFSLASTKYVNGQSNSSFNAYGNVTIGPIAITEAAGTQLKFTGGAVQTFNLSGNTGAFNADITLDKSGGRVVMASDLVMDYSSQDLSVSTGTLDLAGYNLTVDGASDNGTLTVGAGGTMRLKGNEAITAESGYPTFASGSTVEYYGAAGPYTIKNYSYKNLVINSAANVFSLPGNIAVAGNLTISAGILNLAGNDFTVSGTVYNNDTLRLRGSETLTITNDIDSGTVEYVGDGDSAADTFTAKNMSYYNLSVALTDVADTLNSSASSSLDVNGNISITNGTFAAPTSTLYLAGNWSNSATFAHSTGTVRLDGGNQTLAGTTTFYGLAKSAAATSSLYLTSGQLFTILSTTTWNGVSGGLLSLWSTSSGTQALIDPRGSRSVSYLSVKDNNNANATAVTCIVGCVDSGNNTNWDFEGIPPYFTVIYNGAGSLNGSAGTGYVITLTLHDPGGATTTSYTGDHDITFLGPVASPSGAQPTCTNKSGTAVAFGSPTAITFTDGVGTCTLKLYNAATSSVDVTDGTYLSTADPGYDLDTTISPASVGNFVLAGQSAATSGVAFFVTSTARDAYYNTTTAVTGNTTLSVSSGSVLPLTIADTEYSDDAVTTTLVAISGITERPTVVLTYTNGSATGTINVSVTGTPAAPGSVSASRVTDTHFSVSWQDNSTVETGYSIERKTDTGGGWNSYTEINTVAAGETSYHDYTTVADARYQYRVRAFNSLGYSGYGEDSQVHYTTPGAPTDVESARVADTNFSVSWVDNAAVTDSHVVDRCDNAGCDGTYAGISGSPFTSSPQSDTGTAVDGRYRWRAAAGTPDAVTSTYTYSAYEFTTPDAPSALVATVVSDSQIDLAWTDNSGYEDGFRVEVSEDSGAWTEVSPGSNTVGAGVVAYSYAGGSADHYYDFRVRAHVGATTLNGELFSSYSDVSNRAYTSPQAPTDFVATYVSDGQIDLSWTDNSSFEDGFRIELSTDDGGYVEIADVAASPYSHTTTTANHKYIYRIRSYKGAAYSGYATASAVYTTPAAPVIGSSNVDSNTAITWSWTDSSNYEDSFRLDFVVGAGADVDDIAAGSESYQTTGLSPNTEYAVEVHAYRSDRGESAASQTSSSTYTHAAVPSSPSLSVASSTQITFSWLANNNPVGTEYLAANTTTGANSGWVTDLSWLSQGLIPNTQYTFSVIARNALAVDTASSTATSTYTWANMPSSLSINIDSESQLTAFWNANSNPEGTEYYIENFSGGTNSGWITSTTWASSSLVPNTQYTFRVKARNVNGVETGFAPTAAAYTLAAVPALPSASPASSTAITFYWNANSNPGGTEYYAENTATGTNSGWIIATSWLSENLSPNTAYSFIVKARNANNTETAATAVTSTYTLANLPSLLALTADSSSQITASWSVNDNPAGTEYYIENTTAGTNSGWTSSTSWVSDSLNANVSYSFRVKARNSDGVETAYTGATSTYTLAVTPANLLVTGDSAAQITASWEANGNAAGTEYYAENESFGSNSGWNTATSWASTGLNPNTLYIFNVMARNGSGIETATTTATSTYTRAAVPSAPAAVADSAAQITFSWLANDNPAGTEYYASNHSTGANSGWVTDLSWASTGLSPNTAYSFAVMARNALGFETASTTATSSYTLANIPSALSLSVNSSTQIVVAWDANSNPDGTEYYADNITALTNSSWVATTTWASGSLTPNTNYSFSVKARNGDNQETTTTVEVATHTLANIPVGVSLTPDASGQITVAWEANDNASGTEYYVENITSSTNSGWNAGLSYAFTGLGPNASYEFNVKARNGGNIETATTTATSTYSLANVPSGLALTADSQTQITAVWGANENPDGTEYYIENVTAHTASSWSTSTSWLSTGLTCGTSYTFRVKSRNADSVEGAYADAVVATTADCDVPVTPPSTSGGSAFLPSAITPPEGGFRVYINDGARFTKISSVTLRLVGGPNTTRMAVSNEPNFVGISQEDYAQIKQWTLPAGDGFKKVYVKFYNAQGVSSDAVFANIVVDGVPPTIIWNIPASFAAGQGVLVWGATEPEAAVEGVFESERRVRVTVGSDGRFGVNLGVLPVGDYTLSAVATDMAGNTGAAYPAVVRVRYTGEPLTVTTTTPAAPKQIAAGEPTSTLPLVSLITGKLADVFQPIGDKLKDLFEGLKPKEVAFTPIAPIVTVPKIAPPTLASKWELLPVTKFVFAPLPQNIRTLAQKFPELETTLTQVGVGRMTDLSRMYDVHLALPGLTQTVRNRLEAMLAVSTSSLASVLKPSVPSTSPITQTGLPTTTVRMGVLAGPSGKVPLVGIPLSRLSSGEKEQIPTETVFVKTAGGLIDIGVKVALDEQGKVSQRISALTGQQITLIVKPSEPVRSVKGYMVFKERGQEQVRVVPTREISLLDMVKSAIFGAPVLAEPTNGAVVEEKLLLDEFDYVDPDGDGIYTAVVETPVIDGEYDIITVMDYIDLEKGKREIRLVAVIDPEGYVYEKVKGQDLRVKGAVVEIWWRNPSTSEFEQWPADTFQQVNPQTTDRTGRYSFLVPAGVYRLRVAAEGYKPYIGEAFTVEPGTGVHTNIELTPVNNWRSYLLDWKALVLLVFGALLVYNFYRDRQNKK